MFEPLKMKRTCYNPLNRGETKIADAKFDNEANKYFCGFVHDKNARFQKGISANAGVFPVPMTLKICNYVIKKR